MNDRIAAALAPLHGLPVRHAARPGDLLSLQIGEYALHIGCAWRLTGPGGVVTGRADIFRPADDTVTDEELDHLRPGRMLVDVALRRWRSAHESEPLRVRRVRTDRFGGFVLELDEGYALEVFPSASVAAHDSTELWRLFKGGKPDVGHFVLLDSGIDPVDSGID